MVIPTPILISCSTPPLSKSSTHIEKKLRIRRRILANWSVLTHTKMRQHQHQYNRRKTPTLCPRDLFVSIVLWFYSLPLLTFIPQKLWIFAHSFGFSMIHIRRTQWNHKVNLLFQKELSTIFQIVAPKDALFFSFFSWVDLRKREYIHTYRSEKVYGL